MPLVLWILLHEIYLSKSILCLRLTKYQCHSKLRRFPRRGTASYSAATSKNARATEFSNAPQSMFNTSEHTEPQNIFFPSLAAPDLEDNWQSMCRKMNYVNKPCHVADTCLDESL